MCFYECLKFSARTSKAIAGNILEFCQYLSRIFHKIYNGIKKYLNRIVTKCASKVLKVNNVLLAIAGLIILVIGLLLISNFGREMLSSREENLDILDYIELSVGVFGMNLWFFIILVGSISISK
ncbi:hypothetical protein ACOME3_007899 [Neoechinorhynchus agilis]